MVTASPTFTEVDETETAIVGVAFTTFTLIVCSAGLYRSLPGYTTLILKVPVSVGLYSKLKLPSDTSTVAIFFHSPSA